MARFCLCAALLLGRSPGVASLRAAEVPAAIIDGSFHLEVKGYVIEGKQPSSTNELKAIFAKHSGTNVNAREIVQTVSEVQAEYARQGLTNISIAVSPEHSTNGIVRMSVFQVANPIILVSGVRLEPHQFIGPLTEASARPTNAGPRLTIKGYVVDGNDLLSDQTLQNVLTKYMGTNISFADLANMQKELTMEYRLRGYDTVSVTIPQQKITNSMLQLAIFEGTLASIRIHGNRYFSSNNIMRALPGLKTNVVLNSKLFQPELDRANANQDRQIYPQIGRGPDVDTTALDLMVKDRLPLHAKVELNNQSSPGTPDLRLNTSAVYNNFWQHEHSLGVQYSFSPETYKTGDQWGFYDRPLVANYSAFYRMPLANPDAIADVVASNPGSFGYDEATRKFRLPPPSGATELNVYGSRSTIDTGVENTSSTSILNIPGVEQIFQNNFQQDVTINETVGFRLSGPLPEVEGVQSTWSTGFDYKTYSLTSDKTNVFQFNQITVNAQGNPNPPIISTVASPVPETDSLLHYLPFALRYDGTLRDSLGSTSFGLGASVNTWYSGSLANLRSITGSSESHGHWVVLTPSLTRELNIYREWVLSVRADGQWATEPLISNEQFGAGGVASVRGYHEGEVFGDTGWHVTVEQKTPPVLVGRVNPKNPLMLRGSIYTDYARVYLLDPQGRPPGTSLWDAGFGGVMSLGSRWDARLLFSWPLIGTATVTQYEMFFNFSLTAQF
jgi:hemolysin activation/secretion protein